MISIHLHPIEVAARLIPDHWEGDLIKGVGNRSSVDTLMERKSRYLLMTKTVRLHGRSHLGSHHAQVRSRPAVREKDADLRSGQKDGAPRDAGQATEDRRLFRRSAQPLATADQ